MVQVVIPDYSATVQNAFAGGREQARQQAVQHALSMASTDPQAAKNALIQAGEMSGANQIDAMEHQTKLDATRAAAQQQYKAGDVKGARDTAVMGGDPQLADALSKLHDDDLADNDRKMNIIGGFLSTLADVPDVNQRKALVQQYREPLSQQTGVPLPAIDSYDLSDQGLKVGIGQAVGMTKALEYEKGRREEAAAAERAKLDREKFGYQQEHDSATLGETTRHNKADEGMSGARLGMERERLRFDQSQKAEAVFDPQTITAMAQQAWAGDKSVFSNLGRGVQGAQNIAALRKEIYAQGAINGKTPTQLAQMNAQFIGDTAAARTAGTRVGAATVSTEELPGLVQQSADAYSKLPRTQFKPFNQLQQAVMNQTASPEQAAAYAADFAVVNAYARAVSPSGQPHVSDQKRGAELLSNVSGPAEHDAVLRQIIKETATIKAGAQRALHPGGDQPSPTNVIRYDAQGNRIK